MGGDRERWWSVAGEGEGERWRVAADEGEGEEVGFERRDRSQRLREEEEW